MFAPIASEDQQKIHDGAFTMYNISYNFESRNVSCKLHNSSRNVIIPTAWLICGKKCTLSLLQLVYNDFGRSKVSLLNVSRTLSRTGIQLAGNIVLHFSWRDVSLLMQSLTKKVPVCNYTKRNRKRGYARITHEGSKNCKDQESFTKRAVKSLTTIPSLVAL